MGRKGEARTPLTTVEIDVRIKRWLQANVGRHGTRKNMLNAALLAFARASKEERNRLVDAWVDFEQNKQATIEPVALKAS